MTTIGDVARAAGVSRTAVSFAFNDPARLSATTLERILQVAEELGYYPNPLARSLLSKRVGALGLLLPQGIEVLFANPFFSDLLRGIGDVCDRHQFSLLLVPPMQGSLTGAMRSAAVDGYVVFGLDSTHAALDLLRRRAIPFVMVDGPVLADCSSVNVDDGAGAYAAADHLIGLGHRRLLVISIGPAEGVRTAGEAPAYSDIVARRMEGYLAAVAAAQQPIEVRTAVAATSTRLAGKRAMLEAWGTGARPTAVLAMSDSIALGVVEAARELGLQIPADLSIAGFDDTDEARLCDPALTTVTQPSLEKGRRAADLLINRQSGEARVEHLTLPINLVVRDSTTAPAAP